VTWCTKLKMKLITTMKMLRKILCLAKRTTILVQCQAVVAKVKERALLLFKWIEPDKDGVPHSYIFTIPKTKTKLFHLVICYVLCGTFFSYGGKCHKLHVQSPIRSFSMFLHSSPCEQLCQGFLCC
jgi:hypothetical protein